MCSLGGWGKKEKLIMLIMPKSANDHLQEYVFSRPHKLAVLFFKEEELVLKNKTGLNSDLSVGMISWRLRLT